MTNEIVLASQQPAAIRLPQEWEWSMMERYAAAAVKSRLVTGNVTVDQAFFIILKGYELNITPIQALSDIHLINGKPGLSVQLMISLANRSGMLSRLDMPDADDAFKTGKATVTAVRRDRPDSPVTMTFTKEDADKAGLLKRNGAVWNAYMGQMLVNRAVSMVLRRVIPEALSGMMLDDELRDGIVENGAPVPSVTISAIQEDAPKSLPSQTQESDMLRYDDPERFPRFLAWAKKTYGLVEQEVMEALYYIHRAQFKQSTAAQAMEAVKVWAEAPATPVDEDAARFAEKELN